MKSIAELEAAAQLGDPAAFGELIALWDSDLRGVVWSVVRSAVATDDIMQAAYERAFRTIGSFRSDASMKTWLHSICYRTALDHVRYEGHRNHPSVDVLDQQADGRSTIDEAIARADLATLLEQLDPDVRALLMMTAGLGYTFDQVAEITGLERGTVASKVGRAKKALRTLNQPASPTGQNKELS